MKIGLILNRSDVKFKENCLACSCLQPGNRLQLSQDLIDRYLIAGSPNIPSNFLKSVCSQNFLCATFCQHSSIFITTCMKCVKKHFFKRKLVRSKFSCVQVSWQDLGLMRRLFWN